MDDCLFCKIVSGTIPATVTYQDDRVLVFQDIQPQAPVHLLVIPKQHIGSLDKAGQDQTALLGHLLATCAKVARDVGIAETGYRVVANTGAQGGQTVYHIHLHVLGGRQLTWPPG